LTENLILFAPFWVRDLFAWDGKGGAVGLVRHLLTRYKVPGFLEGEWALSPEVPRLKWQCWYILLGQGGSLRRAARHFNWTIVGNFQRYVREAPTGLSPLEVCLFAEVRRVGGGEKEFRAILAHSKLVFDPTESGTPLAYLQSWDETVRWLISVRNDGLTSRQTHCILSWMLWGGEENRNSFDRADVSWKKMGARQALERALDFHNTSFDPDEETRWSGRGLDWRLGNSPPHDWEIVELTSNWELGMEGWLMKHCVHDYASRCEYGMTSIFSMRKGGERRLTIELNPLGRVVQVRGMENRAPTQEEIDVLEQWPLPDGNSPAVG
jgi:hypothetical protein